MATEVREISTRPGQVQRPSVGLGGAERLDGRTACLPEREAGPSALEPRAAHEHLVSVSGDEAHIERTSGARSQIEEHVEQSHHRHAGVAALATQVRIQRRDGFGWHAAFELGEAQVAYGLGLPAQRQLAHHRRARLSGARRTQRLFARLARLPGLPFARAAEQERDEYGSRDRARAWPADRSEARFGAWPDGARAPLTGEHVLHQREGWVGFDRALPATAHAGWVGKTRA